MSNKYVKRKEEKLGNSGPAFGTPSTLQKHRDIQFSEKMFFKKYPLRVRETLKRYNCINKSLLLFPFITQSI